MIKLWDLKSLKEKVTQQKEINAIDICLHVCTRYAINKQIGELYDIE